MTGELINRTLQVTSRFNTRKSLSNGPYPNCLFFLCLKRDSVQNLSYQNEFSFIFGDIHLSIFITWFSKMFWTILLMLEKKRNSEMTYPFVSTFLWKEQLVESPVGN